MLVALFTVKLVAFTPLNFTAVAPIKLVPVKVTVDPVWPWVGEVAVIEGMLDVITTLA